MKKSLISFSLFLITLSLLFTSCQKEYGYYSSSRLKVVADLTDAVYELDEQNEGDFVLDKEYALRVQYFLYDAHGNLFADASELVDGYYHTQVYRFEDVPLGDYTLIVSTDVVLQKGKNSYEPFFWSFEGVDRLSTFTVRGLDQMDVMGERLLTLTEREVTVNGRRSTQRVSLDVEPVTAMVLSTFLDVFYWDKNVVSGERGNRIFNYFDLSYKHDYNVVTYNPSRKEYPWLFSESTTEFDYYLLDRIYPDKLDAKNVKNIYGYHAVLPGSYNFTGYGEYTFGGSGDVFSNQTRTSGSGRFEPGGMYYVDFDIKEWEVNLEGTAYSRAARQAGEGPTVKRSDIYSQSFKDEIHGSNVRHRSLQRDSQ